MDLHTCQNGWHHAREHGEEHCEECATEIIVDFTGFAANVIINHTDDGANNDMCRQTHVHQLFVP